VFLIALSPLEAAVIRMRLPPPLLTPNTSAILAHPGPEMYTALTYTPTSPTIYATCDDRTLQKFTPEAEPDGAPVDLDAHVTDIDWFPMAGKQVVEMFAAVCTDGRLVL